MLANIGLTGMIRFGLGFGGAGGTGTDGADGC